MEGGVIGLVGSAIKNISDDVGARRAALTRASELTRMVGDLPESNDPMYAAGVTAYNWNFNPATGSFNPSSPSSTITEQQTGPGGVSWVTDFNHVGYNEKTGVSTEYSTSALGTTDSDGNFSWNTSVADDIMASIERELDGITVVTVTSTTTSKSSTGSDRPTYNGKSVVMGGGNVVTSTGGTPVTSGRSNDDNDNRGGGGGGTDSGSSAATASDNDTSDYSGYMNKGGYVTKKNKPKVATMQYSKGSK
jgi:hypothetical protein